MTKYQLQLLDVARRQATAVAALADAMIATHNLLEDSLNEERVEHEAAERPSDVLESRAVFGRGKIPTSPDEVPA
jgi:hypothetical protein